jgi:hypothetical protein
MMVPVVTSELPSLIRRSEAISSALADCRERLRVCLLAAGVRCEDTEDLLLDAIASVKAGAWLGSNPSRVLVQAVDSTCAQYAEARSVPYRGLLLILQRQLPRAETLMTAAGISHPAREELLRTLVRTTPARVWSEAENPDDLFLRGISSLCARHLGRSS